TCSAGGVPMTVASSPDAPAEDVIPQIRFRLPGEKEFTVCKHPSGDVETGDDDSARQRLGQFLLGSLQMQHLLVLSGSGTSVKAGGPRMHELWQKATKDFEKTDQLFQDVGYGGEDGEDNIEELLSRCDALLHLRPNERVEKFRG